MQAAAIIFDNGMVEGGIPELPADISDASLTLDGQITENFIPIPLQYTGNAELTLQLYNEAAGSEVVVRGTQAALILIGEPDYIEDFPGAKTNSFFR